MSRQNPVQEEQQNAPRRRKRKRRSKLPAILISLVLVFGLSAMLALFALSSVTDLLGLNQPDRDVDVVIEKGMGVGEITRLLHSKGIVEQPLTFRLYVRLRYPDTDLQAGEYVLNSNMSYDQLIGAMKRGDVVREEIRLTFYEGMTLREIADRLEENGVCDAAEFVEYVESSEFEYEFCSLIPDPPLRYYRMEGYLFPDTYDFYKNEMVASVAKKFLRTFQSVIYEPLREEIEASGMTLDEVVTLASVIQKEASEVDQMGLVASVFRNRLDNPAAGLPRLQSDVTKDYWENEIRPYQEMATPEIYDAYDTYVCFGLPVGPICSPGLDAVKAALHPEESNYYFFVTDANGEYYYGRTLDEHDVNVYNARRVGKIEHGTAVDG